MLIVRNLTKIYRTKGGVETRALDDVSLSFPETGMVFLLGKSGSGKSTLLNICGGLDTPDEGEIIMRGRSSKDFTKSDFDSYRNTFVGFVFQEYNILNEFSVEENLSLALELQGRGRDKKKVDELLEQVDLKDFAKRRPNTLSGGQKQRIAIARALIKDPKIIMADEPTGALDSNTGRQVMDNLKKLSRDRLVIVVSHDREFAEVYGDRIIELKDGRVISDITKERIESKKLNDNVSIIADNTLSIRNGSTLSDSEIAQVTNFIKNSTGDVIISNGEKDIRSFKKSNRIDDDDRYERFEDTENVTVREYTSEEGKFIKSKLPMGKAMKIGASSLKLKPIRLFFTILLSIAAFMLFGVFSTMMTYDQNTVLADSLSKSDYSGLKLGKYYKYHTKNYYNKKLTYEYDGYSTTYFDDSDLKQMTDDYGDDTLGIFSLDEYDNQAPSNINSRSSYVSLDVRGYSYAGENSRYRHLLAGTYPTNDDEVAISQYYYKAILASTFYPIAEDGTRSNESLSISDYEDLIGQYMLLSDSRYLGQDIKYKITAIYDAGVIPSEYYGWDDSSKTQRWQSDTQMNWRNYLEDSIQQVFLVSDTFVDNYISEKRWTPSVNVNESPIKYFTSSKGFSYTYEGEYSGNIYISYYKVFDPSDRENFNIEMFDSDKDSLNANEVITNLSNLSDMVMSKTYVDSSIPTDFLSEYNTSENSARRDEYEAKYNEYVKLKEQDPDSNQYSNHVACYYLVDHIYDILVSDSPSLHDLYDYLYNLMTLKSRYEEILTQEEFADLGELQGKIIRNTLDKDDLTVTFKTLDSATSGPDYFDAKIVGYYTLNFKTDNSYNYTSCAFISSEDEDTFEPLSRQVRETRYTLSGDAKYLSIYVDMEQSMIKKLVNSTNQVKDDDSYFAIDNTLSSKVTSINYMVENFRNIFLYVGIGLAVFAALLLFNFISVSISNKTHEIGVLRAIGARGWDIFKIFFAESFIITAICLVFSIIGSIALVAYLNNTLTSALGFSYSLFVFGIFSLAMMIGEAILVAFIGTFLPVFRVSRKKPVESMRTL